MTRDTKPKSKPRRLTALIAVLALAGALGGCVAYPAGGYYGGGYYGGGYYGGGHHHEHHWDHDRWR
jgi:uncharacterized membrane protein